MNRLIFSIAACGLLATPAVAADLALAAAPSMISPVSAVDWTGIYVGAFGSAGVGEHVNELDDEMLPVQFIGTGSGFLLGAQIGADYQLDNFVFGGVADIAYSTVEASMRLHGVGEDDVYFARSRLDYLATLRGRAGVSFDNALLYAHGGVAFGQVTSTEGIFAPASDYSFTRVGYTVGAGLEYKLSNSVSMQAEYAYTDLGKELVLEDQLGRLTDGTTLHTVKVGLNYRF